MSRALLVSALFAVLAAGCATTELKWRPLDQPTTVKRNDIVWVWSQGMLNRWRAVVLAPDSVSGVPWYLPLNCDSCRLSLPLTQVDSMRLGHEHHNVPLEVLAGIGIVTAAIILDGVVCYLFDRNNPQC